jgi:gluconate 5-dehydrogenase
MSDSLEDAVAKICEQVGPITILVNNAGIHLKMFAQDTTVTEFSDVWATHVRGAFAMTRAVLPSMLERRRGSSPRSPSNA